MRPATEPPPTRARSARFFPLFPPSILRNCGEILPQCDATHRGSASADATADRPSSLCLGAEAEGERRLSFLYRLRPDEPFCLHGRCRCVVLISRAARTVAESPDAGNTEAAGWPAEPGGARAAYGGRQTRPVRRLGGRRR